MFEAWLLSFASRQLNMAKSCFEMNFSVIRKALLLIQDINDWGDHGTKIISRTSVNSVPGSVDRRQSRSVG